MTKRSNEYKVKAWSFSAWSQYDECPAKFAYQRRDRLEIAQNPAMLRGIEIHTKGEYYLTGRIRGVPPAYRAVEQELKNLKKAGAFAEDPWAITKAYEACDNKDWDRVWSRVKTDAHVPEGDTLHVIDFKTGGIYHPKAELQAEVIALHAPAQYEYDTLSVEFWHLDRPNDEDKILTFEFSYEQSLALRKVWEKRVVPMFKDREFRPKPSRHACRFCPFRSDLLLPTGKPGPCTLWV